MATKEKEPELPRIFAVRKVRVVLDSDLAKLYGVPTMRLNEAVKRNARRFPADFSFHVTQQERAALISQIAISSSSKNDGSKAGGAVNAHGGTRKLPRVFTEHGALMAATVLRSERAIDKPKIGFHRGDR